MHIHPRQVGLFVLSVVLLLCGGCASTPLHTVTSFVTNHETLISGKRTPMNTFTLDDTIRVFVDLQWDDPTKDAGYRDVKWNWYSGDKLISTGGRQFHFKHTPYELWGAKPASALGTGNFKVDVLVDNRVVTTQEFTIAEK